MPIFIRWRHKEESAGDTERACMAGGKPGGQHPGGYAKNVFPRGASNQVFYMLQLS